MIKNEIYIYIFIHIPKTAGRYVRDILTKYFNIAISYSVF